MWSTPEGFIWLTIWSQLIIEGVWSGTQVGGEAGTIQESGLPACFPWCTHLASYTVQGHLPSVSLLIVGWILPQQWLTTSVSYRLAYSPIWWRIFLGWGFLLSGDLSVCQGDKKLPSIHKYLETNAWSMTWKRMVFLLLFSFCDHLFCVVASEEKVGSLPRQRGCGKCLWSSIALSFLCFKRTPNSLSAWDLESASLHQIAEKMGVFLPGSLSFLS